MGDKPGVMLAYILVGIAVFFFIPVRNRRHLFPLFAHHSPEFSVEPRWISILATLLAAMLLLKLRHALPLSYLTCGILFGVAVGLSNTETRWRSAVGVVLGFLIATVLPWWLRDNGWNLSISNSQVLTFFLVAAPGYWILAREPASSKNQSLKKSRISVLIYAAFSLAVALFVLSASSGVIRGNILAWHHWSAYVGPAQLIAAGALPLRDIPLQYGLGPSLVLAQTCKVDCWAGMYWLSSLSTIAFTYALAAIALQFNRSRHPLAISVTLALVAASCLLWTSYPPQLSGAIATPSTGGMRFLPGVLMLLWALRRSENNDPLTSSAIWGHLLWLTCILWSPEAGVHATAIWVPYFVWTRTSAGGASYFLRSVASLAAALIGGIATASVAYRMIFLEWPVPGEYLVYVLNPPGAMPINPNGSVWFAVATMACWCVAISVYRNTPDTRDGRASWLVALLALATFTYYLGRSHDNNILNLMPCLSLLLMATRAISAPGVVRTLSTALLVTVLAFTTLFGGMRFVKAEQDGQLWSFAPQALIESFSRESPGAVEKTGLVPASDISEILQHIHETYHEQVEVFDPLLVIDSREPYPPWSALHGPANLALLPTTVRQNYIARIAKRFHRPGWLLYEKSFTDYVPQHLLELDMVYDRTKEIDFGRYKAVRYAPK